MALRRILFVAMLAGSLLGAASEAYADDLKIAAAKYRTGNGGGFLVTGYDTAYLPPAANVMQFETATDQDFITFCIEWQESISLGTSYDYTVDDTAYGGSFGASGGQDDLGEATAKLFYAYWTGQLETFVPTFDYDSTSTRASKEQQLQYALWDLEGESVDDGGASPSVGASGNTLAAALVSWAESATWASLGEGQWTGIGNVRVLNLRTGSTNMQSQLVVLAPLPASALMGLAMLAGLGIVGLRRRRHGLSLN